MSSVVLRERIERRLKEIGMKQIELARSAGITKQELNAFIRGRQVISLEKLERIFEILGL